MAKNDAIEAQSANGLKLIDINIDCLEKIFAHASFDDFINIAHTNKQLKVAADLAFAKKYRNKQFNFYARHERNRTKESDNMMFICDPKVALRLLRSFGHVISKMEFHAQNKRLFNKVLRYTNEYCSVSYAKLTDISFSQIIFTDTFEWSFEQPFSTVKNVQFRLCTFPMNIF